MLTIARYDDIREISRDPARFCSSMGALVNDPMRTWERPTKAPSILHMDPPDHVGFRKLVNREFTPRAIADLEPRIRELACTVLDRTPDSGVFDFVDLVAAPFPLMVIAELLGIPDGDRPDFRRWSDATIEATDKPPEETAEATGELFKYLMEHIAAKKAHPGDDVVSILVRRRGRRSFARPRRAADLPAVPPRRRQRDDTHVDLRRNARALRASRPARRARRRPDAHPGGGRGMPALGHADSGVRPNGDRRHRHRWCRGEGARLPRDALRVGQPRREHAFGPTADVFDIRRDTNPPHLAFGFGEHLCLGAALARMEARILFEEMLRSAPGLRRRRRTEVGRVEPRARHGLDAARLERVVRQPAPATFAELVLSRGRRRHRRAALRGPTWSWREVVAEARVRAELLVQLRRPGPVPRRRAARERARVRLPVAGRRPGRRGRRRHQPDAPRRRARPRHQSHRLPVDRHRRFHAAVARRNPDSDLADGAHPRHRGPGVRRSTSRSRRRRSPVAGSTRYPRRMPRRCSRCSSRRARPARPRRCG